MKIIINYKYFESVFTVNALLTFHNCFQVSTVNPFSPKDDLVLQRVSKIRQGAAGDPLNQGPVHLTPTSSTGADGQVISFTIAPTEEGTVPHRACV